MEVDQFSNEELLNSALNDAPEVTEQVTESDQQADTRARDEQGRFTEKPVEPEKPAVEQQAKPAEQPQESPGVRQLREALERSNRRADELERRFIAQQPKPEAPAKPDIFEKPDEFVRSNVQEALSPVQQEIASVKEFFSRQYAIDKHGEETVTKAYQALDQSAKAGDPQALAVVQAVKQSMNPFMEIVAWHRGTEASRDPDAFFQRKLEEALKDEKFKGELMQKLQPTQEEVQAKPVFRVPPTMRNVPSAAPVMDDGGDFSNESLLASALR